MNTPALITADAVFPVCTPPILSGAVAISDGRVARVGPADDLLHEFRGAPVTEARGCILTPGLVNAHCHLELGYLRGKIPAGHFVDWVIRLNKEVTGHPGLPAAVRESLKTGISELIAGGVTHVGDISKQVALARPVLREGPIRSVSFGEVQALGKRRELLGERLAVARDSSLASPAMRIGLSPHAPYTVEGPALSAILDAADTDKLPLCMHVAELTEEAEFLRTCGGEIRRAWEAINLAQLLLDEKIPRFEGGPVRWARQWGLLPPGGVGAPVALAHVNYADDEEIDIIRAAGASVVYCPRTRAFFGHDAVTPHRFRDMLDAGVNVCLGTDSLASNPDLFLLREARFLLRKDPTLSPTLLLEMVTSGGSRALGTSHDAGTLAEGCSADIAAFPLSGAHGSAEAMLRDVIGRAPGASAVWIGGAKVL